MAKKRKSKKISVTRYVQDPAHCAVAAISSVGNFYNKDIDYEYVKEIAYAHDKNIKKEGMYTSDIGIVLNKIGFEYSTVITTDLEVFDYEWSKGSKKSMRDSLDKRAKTLRGESKHISDGYVKYLDEAPRNKIIIDYNFGNYIRKYLDSHRPLILSYNWTMFHKWEGTHQTGEEHHAVVAHGYDDKYVYITDSHVKHYVYRLSKYRDGKYKMSWENLMTVMGVGDVILPENFKGE